MAPEVSGNQPANGAKDGDLTRAVRADDAHYRAFVDGRRLCH